MHSEQEYYCARIGKPKGDVIADPDKHIPYFVPAIQNGRTPFQVAIDHNAGRATLRIVQKQIYKDPSAASPAVDQWKNPNNFMPPEKIILLPPTHESLPSFHVQGDLLPSFLDHLANSGIKVPEPPEPQDHVEAGAISVVGVDVEEGISLQRLQEVLDEFLRSHGLPASSQRS